MKNISFGVFNIISLLSIILLIIVIIIPFNLINLEQAQRIATWKTVYDELDYSFKLVCMHEGKIIPDSDEAQKILTEEYIWELIGPYINMKSNKEKILKKYNYRKMNASPINKNWKYYFHKFYEMKNGMLLSLKSNETELKDENHPLYYMFLDINGVKKPNRIGQDIFIINIYKDRISALGEGKPYSRLKTNCSPIGSGLYCSEYYLRGGSF